MEWRACWEGVGAKRGKQKVGKTESMTESQRDKNEY